MLHLCKDFYLTADNRQFIVMTQNIVQKGKNKGSKVFAEYRYFPTLDQIFDYLIHRLLFDILKQDEIETCATFQKQYLTVLNEVKEVSIKIGNVKNIGTELASEEI